MAETVHDGWYALHGMPEPPLRAERARQAAALYSSGMSWPQMRAVIRCDMNDLGNLIREGVAVPGYWLHWHRAEPTPIGEPRIDRWTREVQATPSPHADAALTKHTATVWQWHADLGIAPPVLP